MAPSRERNEFIWLLRYGHRKHTYKDIGLIVGLSWQRVRTIAASEERKHGRFEEPGSREKHIALVLARQQGVLSS